MLTLTLLLACRDPAPALPPDDGYSPVGDTADTVVSTTPLTSTAAPTGATGYIRPTGATSHTGTAGSTADTGRTGHTGHTGDTGPTHDTCGRPVGTKRRTTPPASTTGDTATCGQFPASYPSDTAPPPTVDTGLDCGTGTPPACPQVAWVLPIPGATDNDLKDVETLPGGDALLYGADERGVTFHEGEPNEFTLPEICPGVDDTPWIARIDSQGDLVWAMRPVDGCSSIHPGELHVSESGLFAAWGDYHRDPITFAPGTASAWESPPVQGSADLWVASFDADGTYLQGHVLVQDDYPDMSDERIRYGAVADDGTLYAAGEFQHSITIDPGQPWEVTLSGETTSFKHDIWVAAWNADGSLRWARRDGSGDRGTASVAAILVDSDGPSLFAIGVDEVVWDACGPMEVAQDMGVNEAFAVVRYDGMTGETVEVRTAEGRVAGAAMVSGGFMAFGSSYLGQEAQRFGDDVVPAPSSYIGRYSVHCDDFRWARYNPTGLGMTGVSDFDLGGGYVVAAGYGTSLAWQLTTQYGCGPNLGTTPDAIHWQWYLFDERGEPLCGDSIKADEVPLGASYGAALDEGGNLYYAASFKGRGRIAEGTPHELVLDTDDSDVILLRYEW